VREKLLGTVLGSFFIGIHTAPGLILFELKDIPFASPIITPYLLPKELLAIVGTAYPRLLCIAYRSDKKFGSLISEFPGNLRQSLKKSMLQIIMSN